MSHSSHPYLFYLKLLFIMEEKKEEQVYRCNDCGGVIHKHDVFCDKCGKKLDHFDFED